MKNRKPNYKPAFLGIVLTGLLAIPLAIPMSAAAPLQGSPALDGQIESYLRQEYAKNKSFVDVHAAVADRVVTLTGSVPDYRSDLEAAHEARQVASVNGVIDRLRVNAPYVSDDQLEKNIAERLTYDRMGMGQIFNALTLKVQSGIVTVGGNVHDYASRDSALDIVEDTRGVRGVRDQIQVAPTSLFDDQIRFETARAIYRNPTLRRYALDPAHPIRIVVNNGHVTLDGVVSTSLDKTVAGHAARGIPGVFSVQNNLVVASGKD